MIKKLNRPKAKKAGSGRKRVGPLQLLKASANVGALGNYGLLPRGAQGLGLARYAEAY